MLVLEGTRGGKEVGPCVRLSMCQYTVFPHLGLDAGRHGVITADVKTPRTFIYMPGLGGLRWNSLNLSPSQPPLHPACGPRGTWFTFNADMTVSRTSLWGRYVEGKRGEGNLCESVYAWVMEKPGLLLLFPLLNDIFPAPGSKTDAAEICL